MTKLEQHKSVIQTISLIVGIAAVVGNLIYNTIVLQQTLKNSIKANATNIERLEYQIKQLDNDKVNSELFNMVMNRLDRIENKLDKLQENN